MHQVRCPLYSKVLLVTSRPVAAACLGMVYDMQVIALQQSMKHCTHLLQCIQTHVLTANSLILPLLQRWFGQTNQLVRPGAGCQGCVTVQCYKTMLAASRDLIKTSIISCEKTTMMLGSWALLQREASALACRWMQRVWANSAA